jgi:hypothetical protein
MSDEELLIISSRLCHFLMREYISPHTVFHIPDGHMDQFVALCVYLLQGQAQQVKTHKKFKQICGCPLVYQLVHRKVVLCSKHIWCLMMNTCLSKHVFGDAFNQFLCVFDDYSLINLYL